MYRQGDVLLIPIERQDNKKLKKVSKQGEDIVLAEGETTGHAHRIAARFLATMYVIAEAKRRADAQRVLRVEQEATLSHEEHGPITLPPGDYEVVRQREYTPTTPRMVAD